MNLIEALKKYGKARRACWKSSPVLEDSYVMADTCGDLIDETGMYAIFNLTFLDDDWEEYREPILNDMEKEYLNAVIKPFRDRVRSIRKTEDDGDHQYIRVTVARYDQKETGKGNCVYEDINLPSFKKDMKYINMETNKNYTLEELGL